MVVSNHGGQATETGRATTDILPEVVGAVGSQMPVFVDGGFRRGTEVYKASAMGAHAVGIGRAYIYGLSPFGQERWASSRHPVCRAYSSHSSMRHADDSADHAGFNSQKWAPL